MMLKVNKTELSYDELYDLYERTFHHANSLEQRLIAESHINDQYRSWFQQREHINYGRKRKSVS